MNDSICMNCKHFRFDLHPARDRGECHFNPPIIMVVASVKNTHPRPGQNPFATITAYPSPTISDDCSKFERKIN
jgi:hypothetical protein